MDIADLVLTPASPPKKKYWEVLDEYRQDTSGDPELSKLSVNDYATRMNQVTGSQAYDAATGPDNAVRRWSGTVDYNLHHFFNPEHDFVAKALGAPEGGLNLPDIAGQGMKYWAQQAGAGKDLSDEIEQVGEGMPRMAFDIGLPTIAGLATGGMGVLPAIAATTGASTYGETGSLTKSGITAASSFVFPKVAEAAGNAALKLVGGKVLADAAPDLLQKATILLGKDHPAMAGIEDMPVIQNLLQGAAKFTGGQLGMFGTGLATEAAQIGVDPTTSAHEKLSQLADMFDPNKLVGTAVSQLPFTALDLAGGHWRPQGNLEAEMLPAWKADFARRFTAESERVGQGKPEPSVVNKVIDRILSGKPDAFKTDDQAGRVLASMGQSPVSIDMSRAVKTNVGDWPMPDAIEHTSNIAQAILLGRGVEDVRLDENRIYAAIRASEGQGLSRDQIARQAASRAVDTATTDSLNLAKVSGTYSDQSRYETDRMMQEVKQNSLDLEIAQRVMRTFDDGSPNPAYDDDLHKKIALVSGDVDHRVQAGITDPVVMASAGGTRPLDTSIIDMVRGLRTKVEAKGGNEMLLESGQQRVKELDEQIAALESGGDMFAQGNLEDLRTQRATQELTNKYIEADQLSEKGKTRAYQLTADATFAARRAAYQFKERLDFNNPVQIATFVSKVRTAIRRAELGFLRKIDTQKYAKDAEGKIVSFKTRSEALAEASRRQESSEDNTNYSVPKRARPDGTFPVLENTYYRTLSASPHEAGMVEAPAEVGTTMPTEAETETRETGIHSDALDALGEVLGKIEREKVIDSFRATAEERDPAIREARKAAIANNVIDYITSMPDSRLESILKQAIGPDAETGKMPQIREPALRKARFVKFLQFLQQGGDINLTYERVGDRLKVRGTGDLEALNTFMGEHGFKRAEKAGDQFHDSKLQGLNFFEQFHILSKHLQSEFANPKDFDPIYARPRGDFAWVPPGFRDDKEFNLLVDWPTSPEAAKNAIGSTTGPWAVPNGQGQVVVMKTRDGETRRFESDLNPLLTAIVKGTRHQLTMTLGSLHDLFKTYNPHGDPFLMDMLKKFTDNGFGRNINVGFGMAKDANVKGYYHYGDDLTTGTGILLSPYSTSATGKRFRSLDDADAILPHLVHEVAHAHTVFAYHNDPEFKAEWDRTFDYIKDRHDTLKETVGLGRFEGAEMHGLTDPLELMATVFHDTQLHDFLRTIADPFNSTGTSRSLFDRVVALFRRAFSAIVGEKDAGTMLDRVTSLAGDTVSRTYDLQRELGIVHRGDIYGALTGVPPEGRKSDVISTGKPQPVPKTDTSKLTYPWAYQGKSVDALGFDPTRANWKVAVAEVKDLEKSLKGFEDSKISLSGIGDPLNQKLPGQVAGIDTRIKETAERLEQAKKYERDLYLKLNPDTVPVTDEAGMKAAGAELGLEHQGIFEGTDIHTFNDPEHGGNLDFKLGTTVKEMRARIYWKRKQFEAKTPEEYKDVKAQEEKYNGEIPSDAGRTMESRVTSTEAQGMVDSLQAASEMSIEDSYGLWFKPISNDHFMRTFEPALGTELRPERLNGLDGYRVSPVALRNMTKGDLAVMPDPQVQPYAPSAFETFKQQFVAAGESEQNATALAAYNLQLAAVLKNTEGALWGKLPVTETSVRNKIMGAAWMPRRLGALAAPETAEGFTRAMTHEAAHLAGVQARWAEFTPMTSDLAQAMYHIELAHGRLSVDERQEIMQGLVNISNESREFARVYKPTTTDAGEFAAEFMAHIGEGIVGLPKPNAYVTDMLRHAPDELANFAVTFTIQRAQGLDKLREMLPEMATQRGMNPDRLSTAVEMVAGAFKGLARSATEIALDQADFYRMRALYPDVYKQKVKDAADQILGQTPKTPNDLYPQGTTLESRTKKKTETGEVTTETSNLFKDVLKHFEHPDNLPEKPSLWMRSIAQFVQLADQYPRLRPFYDMLANVQGMERIAIIQMQTAAAGAWSGKRLLDDTRTKNLGKFATNEKLRDAFSSIALDMQTEGDARYRKARGQIEEAGGTIFDMQPIDFITPEYMDAMYRKYGVVDDKERAIMDTVFEGTRNQIKLASAKIVDAQRVAIDTIAAKAVLKGTDLDPSASRDAAKLMSDALRAQRDGRMNDAINLQNEFNAKVPDTNTQARVFSILDDGQNRVAELERFLTLRMPYYMSERQMGDYGLWWRNADDKLVRKYFRSEKDMNHYITSKSIEPVRQIYPGDKNMGVSPELFDKLNEFQNSTVEKIKDILGEDEAQKLAGVFDVASELRAALSARDVTKMTTPRKGGSSRQTLDMFDTHQDYVRAVITAAKNRQMRMEADLMLDTPEFANQPVLKRLAQDHIASVMKPDSKLGNFVASTNFLYFMGYNVSNMILEPFQQLSALAPVLTQNGATVKDSYGLIAKANKMWIESRSNKGKYRDAEMHAMMQRAQQEGVVDLGVFSEIEHNEDLSLVNRIRQAGGLSQWGPFELLKNRVYQFSSLARRFYGQVPAYNSEIAFAAAYMHAKSQGLTGEAAYSQARFLKEKAMFGGGKINRPVGLFAQAPRTAAQAMWSLQSYSSSMTTMMGNLVKQSFSKGMTPAQSTQVRKAAIQMLGTQLVLAGSLGMPFVQVGINILQKLFPSENIELDVRNALGQIEGDDKALGGWLSSTVTTGLPSALDFAPDMGSRFAIGGTMGVSPYSGISLDNMIGPTASVVRNVFKAMGAGLRGDAPQTVEQLMPRGLQRIWKTLEEGNTFESNQGDVLTSDLSPAERAGRLLGFTPNRVTRLREAANLDRISKDAAKEEQRQWVEKVAGDVIAGNDSRASEAVHTRAGDGFKGFRDRRDLARAVAKRVEEKTLPVDTRSFGNSKTLAEGQKLRAVAGTQPLSVSGQQRLALQASIAQRLGVPSAIPSGGTVRRVNMVEHLLQLYPSLTTQQAGAIAARQSTADQFLE
jgi:hypothetical protein